MVFFLYILLLNYSSYLLCDNFLSVVQCGLESQINRRKFFIMRNHTCYIPQTRSSQTADLIAQKTYFSFSGNLILFRVVSGSGINTYEYFVDPTNSSQSVGEVFDNHFENVRSELLDEWDAIRPSQVNITIRDYNDHVVAGLSFNVKMTDNMTSWFSKTNLINSFPWNVKYLKKSSYNFFSIIGEVIVERRFYISEFYKLCPGDVGVLGVMSEIEVCPYGYAWRNSTKSLFPQILIVNNNSKAGIWNMLAAPMKSLELTGIYDSDIKFYI